MISSGPPTIVTLTAYNRGHSFDKSGHKKGGGVGRGQIDEHQQICCSTFNWGPQDACLHAPNNIIAAWGQCHLVNKRTSQDET